MSNPEEFKEVPGSGHAIGIESEAQAMQPEADSVAVFDQGSDPARMNKSGRGWMMKAGAIVALGAVGFGGYMVRGNNETSKSDKAPIVAAGMQTESNNCGAEANFGANRADKVYGSPEATFPSLATYKDGKTELLTAKQASDALKAQLSGDSRVLAIFTAFYMEPRKNLQLPDAATLGRAKTLMKTYKDNAGLASEDLSKACDAVNPDFLVPTDQFAVTRGQTMEIQAARKDGHVTGFSSVKLNTTGNLKGWEISFNKDNTDLTADQKSLYEKLQNLILVTDEGTIDMNIWIGINSIKLDQAKATTPVNPRVRNGAHKAPVSPVFTDHRPFPVSPSLKPGQKPATGLTPGKPEKPGKPPVKPVRPVKPVGPPVPPVKPVVPVIPVSPPKGPETPVPCTPDTPEGC